jgi:hypothetical protein
LEAYPSDIPLGGALYVAAGQVTLTNSSVNNNWAGPSPSSPGYPGVGGGLYIAGGTVTLANTTIESNTADWGGGIYIASGATVYIDPFTVANTINNQVGGNIDGTFILM